MHVLMSSAGRWLPRSAANDHFLRRPRLNSLVPADSTPKALYGDMEDPFHYVWRQRMADRTKAYDLLIIGGEDHKTGQDEDIENRFARLTAWGRVHFPEASRCSRDPGSHRIPAQPSAEKRQPGEGSKRIAIYRCDCANHDRKVFLSAQKHSFLEASIWTWIIRS